MADVTKTVRFVLLGDEKGATRALSGVSKGALALGASLAAGAAAAVKFGSDSVKVFQSAAGEAAKLSRITGLAVEDASRLGFAMKQTGVDVTAGTKAFTILGKTLANASRSATSTAAITEALGFSFTDAEGHVLGMSELLPQVADRFASMANGAEKTALAQKLFGKSGADLLPLLSKGSAGLAELARKSDAYGNTISGEMVDKLKAAKQAQRDWDAAMQGVQVTLGSELLPLLTQGAQALNSQLIPAIKGVTGFLRDNGAVMGPLIGVAGALALGLGGVTIAAKGLAAFKMVKDVLFGVAAGFRAMSTAARLASISAGAVGIALTVATALYAAHEASAEGARQAVEDYTAALDADNGALGENTRLKIANRLETDGALEAAQHLGIATSDVVDAVLGQGDSLGILQGRLQGVVDAYDELGSGIHDANGVSVDAMKVAADQASWADQLSFALGDENTALKASVASWTRVSSAAGTATDATEESAAATEDSTDAALKAAQARLALSGSLIGLEGAYDDATAAARENGKTLNIHTEAGRANRAALNQVATAGLSVVQSLRDQGASSKRVSGAMDDARTKYIKAAMAMGVSRDRAKELADKIGLIKSKTVTVKTEFKKVGPTSWRVQASGGGRVSMIPVAGGGIIRRFAAGGMEDHSPKIYRSHDGARLFNEPETRGESYIPLANDWRRPRAVAIWRQTGRELGVYGAGGIAGRAAAAAGDVHVHLEVKVDRFTDTSRVAREIRTALLDLKRDGFRGRGLGLA